MTGWALLLGDVCATAGTVVLTLVVVTLLRVPSSAARIHAASVAAVLAVPLILVATLSGGSPSLALRGGLVGVFALLTAPLSTHALMQLERHTRESESTTAPGGPRASRRG